MSTAKTGHFCNHRRGFLTYYIESSTIWERLSLDLINMSYMLFLRHTLTEKITEFSLTKNAFCQLRSLIHFDTQLTIMVGYSVIRQSLYSLSGKSLTAKSRKVSKPRDWMLQLGHCSDIWRTSWRHCCRCACQISERLEKSKHESRGFETSWDLAVWHLIT